MIERDQNFSGASASVKVGHATRNPNGNHLVRKPGCWAGWLIPLTTRDHVASDPSIVAKKRAAEADATVECPGCNHREIGDAGVLGGSR